MTMRLIVPALLLLSATAPAAADWQYTKWGMSVDQVQKASKGILQRCSGASVCTERSVTNSAAQLYGGYTTGQFNFSAYPMFNRQTSRLDAVTLELSDPTMAGALGAALRAKYGEPVNASRGSIMSTSTWRDRTDEITLMAIGERSVTLRYSPRITASNAGL
jgi:hypothetical protein